ncbi:MAG TPA: hypothetical protein VLZ81_09760 [Blastocatellia bacterium]|nr:hypothetical protein [Blastocatellia bacterium]
MITGFNTDVSFGGCLYHVQTEDRGRDHPFLESLVYVGGTIVAKKRTTYREQADQGATDEAISSMLRRQHQVIIAAIKAGRIEELMRHSAERKGPDSLDASQPASRKPAPQAPPEAIAPLAALENLVESVPRTTVPQQTADAAMTVSSGGPDADKTTSQTDAAIAAQGPRTAGLSGKLGLTLDQVVSDDLKRSSEQGKLEVRVLSPNVFIAGKAVALKVRISRGPDAEPEAIVTVKVIGTAFKPLVFMSRADLSGVATFNFSLPAFSAGTAAIVIEAQSNRGRGELKQLIRRS